TPAIDAAIPSDPARGVATGPKLRIALVTETFPPEINGVAHTLHQMVKSMLERGHRVHLIRPRQHRSDRGTLTPHDRLVEQLTPGLPVPGYKGLHMGLPAGRSIRAAWGRERPDVIYLATEGPLGRSALSAARSLGIPVISGFHTNFHSYSRYYGIGFLEPLIGGYLRRFHKRTHCTLVPTTALREELAQKDFGTCRVLARGVDTTLFSPTRRDPQLRREWGLEADDIAVIYVGRLAAEKNLQLAVDAFRAMQARDPRARFILVGDGPEAPRLRREHPDLILAGVHTGEALARHYASGDVFLFPSTSDTFGNVVLEAMASGLVVVSFNYAAARENLRHGESGVLAPFGDHDRFVQEAVALVDRNEEIPRLGTRARTAAEAVDWTCEHDRLEALFQEYAREDAP
ncbi:MAG: glycosyltransferase family 4 protein, partial [Ectothiorhodospira sp.]